VDCQQNLPTYFVCFDILMYFIEHPDANELMGAHFHIVEELLASFAFDRPQMFISFNQDHIRLIIEGRNNQMLQAVLNIIQYFEDPQFEKCARAILKVLLPIAGERVKLDRLIRTQQFHDYDLQSPLGDVEPEFLHVRKWFVNIYRQLGMVIANLYLRNADLEHLRELLQSAGGLSAVILSELLHSMFRFLIESYLF